MLIAIQEGLKELYNQLKDNGYEVVFYNEQNTGIDAIIYSYPGDYANESIQTTESHVNILNMKNMDVEKATIIINAYNKTIEEILYILQTKLYSPLFIIE